jgi:excisionase family DNA binding protein
MRLDAIAANRAITATVREFCALTGLGITTTYSLLNLGQIDSIKIGKRRLIVLDSYHKLIERQRDAASRNSSGDAA